MVRNPNLRQIDAFKAVIESGTVSRAAEILGVSQPAVSKLLAHLEADIGMVLFERGRGRLLVPTERGMRLYAEITRIFAGIDEVGRAIESIRREDREQLVIGLMPGLSGPFIRQVLERFRRKWPDVYISIASLSSRAIVELLETRQADVGIISIRMVTEHLETEPLLDHPLVCVLPLGHRLAAKARITVDDLAGEPIISFAPGSSTRARLDALFSARGLSPNVVIDASTAHNVCEFVAAGMGVTLEHPLLIESVHGRVAVRPFEPTTVFNFLLCRPRGGRNRELVQSFIEETRETATIVSRELVSV